MKNYSRFLLSQLDVSDHQKILDKDDPKKYKIQLLNYFIYKCKKAIQMYLALFEKVIVILIILKTFGKNILWTDETKLNF